MRIRMSITILTFSVANMSYNLLNAHVGDHFLAIKIQIVITNVLGIAVILNVAFLKNLRC